LAFVAGYWKPYIHLKNAAPFLLRHWIPAIFVAGLSFLAFLGIAWTPAWIALTGVIGLHIGISVWTSRLIDLNFIERFQYWWAIWIIHFAYGVGFWVGFIKWLRKGVWSIGIS
jgi:hypothetical protein